MRHHWPLRESQIKQQVAVKLKLMKWSSEILFSESRIAKIVTKILQLNDLFMTWSVNEILESCFIYNMVR